MDRRKEHRSATSRTVGAKFGAVQLSCTMRNLSQSGCLLECNLPTGEVGMQVTITLEDGLNVPGEVAWQLGTSTGIFFLAPIALDVVQRFALDDWPLRADWTMPREAGG